MTTTPDYEAAQAAPARRSRIRACLAAGILFSLVAAWLLLLTTPEAGDDEHALTTATAAFRMPLVIGLLLGMLGAVFLTAAAATAWSGRRSRRAFP